MKPPLDLRRITLGIACLLILAMANQLQVDLPLGSKGKRIVGEGVEIEEARRIAIPVADIVLSVALVGVVLSLGSRKLRGLKLPPLPAWALVAISLVALLRSPAKADAAKETLQFIEYFLVSFFVFANVAETRHLRLFLTLFAIATALAVGWAACQYAHPSTSAFRVAAGYDNRNALGAFLALALPLFYGLALYARRWPERLVLLLLVAAGLLVDLSGSSVLITLAVLGVLSAFRGQRALVAYLAVLGVVLALVPRVLPRPYHSDILFASVSPYVNDNFLLSDAEMAAQARELFRPTEERVLDHTGEKRVLPAMPFDADRLLDLLAKRRRAADPAVRHKRPLLTPEEIGLQIEIRKQTESKALDADRRNYRLTGPQVAVRYQRWDAALGCIRGLWDEGAGTLFFGRGLTSYHALLKNFMLPNRLQYRTDLPEVFNVAAPEPFTYDIWFRTFIQMGLLGFLALAWLVGAFLGRAAALWRDAHSEFALGVALGGFGSIAAFALTGLFTENIARGIAIPFVFVLAALTVAERIVHGERKTPLEQLTRMD